MLNASGAAFVEVRIHGLEDRLSRVSRPPQWLRPFVKEVNFVFHSFWAEAPSPGV